MPLPDWPYRPLRPYDAADEALFVGRENDLQRLALTLDQSDTQLLVLHGAAAVGKSSLLRAGLVPFLDDDCAGYRVLDDRTPTEDAAAEEERVPLLIRTGGDLAGQLALALAAFCGQPYRYATLTDRTIEIDFAAMLSPLVDGLMIKPEGASLPEIDPEVLRKALRDSELLARLLTALSERLPFELVMVIEQGEELFTLNDDERVPQQALAQSAGRLSRWPGSSGSSRYARNSAASCSTSGDRPLGLLGAEGIPAQSVGPRGFVVGAGVADRDRTSAQQ